MPFADVISDETHFDYSTTLVPLEWLKPHEQINGTRFNEVLEETKATGGYTWPIIADQGTGVILDGHHRHAVAQFLRLRFVPAILVDYKNDPRIKVALWRAEMEPWIRWFLNSSKEDDVDISLSDTNESMSNSNSSISTSCVSDSPSRSDRHRMYKVDGCDIIADDSSSACSYDRGAGGGGGGAGVFDLSEIGVFSPSFCSKFYKSPQSDFRDNSDYITKDSVVKVGISSSLFPPKTTRHVMPPALSLHDVSTLNGFKQRQNLFTKVLAAASRFASSSIPRDIKPLSAKEKFVLAQQNVVKRQGARQDSSPIRQKIQDDAQIKMHVMQAERQAQREIVDEAGSLAALKQLREELVSLGWSEKTSGPESRPPPPQVTLDPFTNSLTAKSRTELKVYYSNQLKLMTRERDTIELKRRRVVKRKCFGYRDMIRRKARKAPAAEVSQLFENSEEMESLNEALNEFRSHVYKTLPDSGMEMDNSWPPIHAIGIGKIPPFGRHVVLFNRRLDSGHRREPTLAVCTDGEPVLFLSQKELHNVFDNIPMLIKQAKIRLKVQEGDLIVPDP